MNTAIRSEWSRGAAGYLGGLVAFFLIAYTLKAVGPSVGIEGMIPLQIALKLLMIVAAMLAWLAVRRPWSEMGWRKVTWRRGNWRWVIMGCAAMALASVAMLLSRSRHPLLGQMSIFQMMLIVWVLSSVSEEIYVRGAVQSWMQVGHGSPEAPALSPAVVSSALLFASMHVPLLWSGAGVLGGSIIVVATLFVGWGCAVLRARTGSLWTAIALHVLANMASVPGGIVGVLVYRLVYGELPNLQ